MYYLFCLIISENYNASSLNVVIVILKRPCINNEFLEEALRILEADGFFVIYEPLQTTKQTPTILTYPERISRLQLSGFKIEEQESLYEDADNENKDFLKKVYNNIKDVYKILASKPPFEVR